MAYEILIRAPAQFLYQWFGDQAYFPRDQAMPKRNVSRGDQLGHIFFLDAMPKVYSPVSGEVTYNYMNNLGTFEREGEALIRIQSVQGLPLGADVGPEVYQDLIKYCKVRQAQAVDRFNELSKRWNFFKSEKEELQKARARVQSYPGDTRLVDACRGTVTAHSI